MAAEPPDASAIPEPASQSEAQVAAAVEAEAVTATATVVEEKPTVPDTASYRLAIRPWGTIFVDGEEHGVSPPLKRSRSRPKQTQDSHRQSWFPRLPDRSQSGQKQDWYD
ncbi:hypothetical protein LP419_34055 [Massilia sp. H-1]|nr:hypothetical protein LP419_34055 [Massilia sp. H-1]